MFQQSLSELKLFDALFEVTENFQHSLGAFPVTLPAFLIVSCIFAGGRVETALTQRSIECIGQRRSVETLLQALVCEFVFAKLVQQAFLFQTGGKLDLA